MSELVEKVARAMVEGEDDDLSPTDRWRARIAIAAVAEWLDGEGRDIAATQLRAAAGSAPTTPEVK